MAKARAVQVARAGGPLPLERAAEAYDRMLSGEARFRVVLTMNE
jgi:D-arabinose 1-dehydrogenase-like Zn-dependent alcohol dehydrogenase